MTLYLYVVYVGFIYVMYIEIIYKILKNIFSLKCFIPYINQRHNKLQG